MKKNIWGTILLIMILAGCAKKQSATTSTSGNTTPNNQHISVLTQHNDNTRAGLNNMETSLTTANVNPAQFGKLFSLPVDDQVYAQPLVVGNLAIGGGTHNVVFIATVNNTVYAYDGDNGTLYWKKNYTVAGMRPPNPQDMASGWCSPYTDFTSNIGIVGTPVIDSASQTIYFVARSTNGTNFVQYLHAVDITNGNERSGSPVEITASVPGTGDGSVGGVVSFDPLRNNQRMGLALVNGVVYISFASHCDWNPYHGWILGYNETTLQQVIVYNDTPDGENGGIWESGQGIAADAQGNLYITTGNGTVGQGGDYTSTTNGSGDNGPNPDPTDLTDRSESALKLTPSGSTLQVTSYFTPLNYYNLNLNDLDYGVMGTFLIPNSNYFVTGCKDGNLYLLDKDNMGGYNASSNQVQQTIPLNVSLHCQPAYYKGSSAEYVYVWSENDQLRALSFNRSSNTFQSNETVATDNGPTGDCGAELSVSSNGTTDGTGIVWATYAISGNAGNTICPGILRAFDANDITQELWNSNDNPNDNLGKYAKYSPPTIADGHVYVPTFSDEVVVYGLK
jgi:outer membrane protein assembly factor BamB